MLERYLTDPYGAVIVLTASWGTRGSSAYGWMYLWQGLRFDGATGLYRFGIRDESPVLMRPLEADPLGLGPDANPYRLEANAPTVYVDPTGEFIVVGGLVLGGAIAGWFLFGPGAGVAQAPGPQENDHVYHTQDAYPGESAVAGIPGAIIVGSAGSDVEGVEETAKAAKAAVDAYNAARAARAAADAATVLNPSTPVFDAVTKRAADTLAKDAADATAKDAAKALAKGTTECATEANLRQLYTDEVAGLDKVGKDLLASGKSESEVAKTLNQMRRDLGIKYKDMTPPDLREYIYKFNEARYEGDKLGPTYEYLKGLGKTDADIIKSASKPLGDDKQLGAALYKMFGEEIAPILRKYGML